MNFGTCLGFFTPCFRSLLAYSYSSSNLGGTVSKYLLDLAKSLWMWCLERNIHIIVQHQPERNNRYGVSDNERSVRLAAESCETQQDLTPFRSHRDGFVRISSNGAVPSLFQLAAGSVCSGNRFLPAGQVSNQGVCQPTLESDRSGTVQSTNGQGSHCSGGTSLEDTPMVATPY